MSYEGDQQDQQPAMKLPPGAVLESGPAAPMKLPPGAVLETGSQPSGMSQFLHGDQNSLPTRLLHGAGLPGSFAEVVPWAKNLIAPRNQSVLEDKSHELPIVGPALKAQDQAAERAARPGATTTEKVMAKIPVLGPMAENFGDNLASGNYAGAAGGVAGATMLMREAAPEISGQPQLPVPGAASRWLYRSMLKPSKTLGGEKIGQIVDTGIREQIPITEAGVDKLWAGIENLNDAIKQGVDAIGPKRVINPGNVAAKLDDVKAKFAAQVNPADDLAAIEKSREGFLEQFRSQPGQAVRNLTADEAQAMKTGTYRQLKSRAYGELGSATIEAQKGLARGLKEELEAQFPELKNLNAQDAKLLDLSKPLEDAVQRLGNRSPFSLAGPIAGTILHGFGADAKTSIAAGFMKWALDQPRLRSELAFALARANGKSILVNGARLTQYAARLGAVSQPSPGESSDQSTSSTQ